MSLSKQVQELVDKVQLFGTIINAFGSYCKLEKDGIGATLVLYDPDGLKKLASVTMTMEEAVVVAGLIGQRVERTVNVDFK